jgi:ABC-type antimicrobial peptide transport system permease subunit
MAQVVDDSPPAYLHRASAWLAGTFGGLAFLLSVVGLYGVISYSVSQRTREIGVSMALGAARGSVYTMVLREAARLPATGIAAGLICSIGGAALMRKLLFGTKRWDIPYTRRRCCLARHLYIVRNLSTRAASGIHQSNRSVARGVARLSRLFNSEPKHSSRDAYAEFRS